jgi:hypothetical protein
MMNNFNNEGLFPGHDKPQIRNAMGTLKITLTDSNSNDLFQAINCINDVAL